MNGKKRATDFILGIILHLITVIQINIISFCLGKRDTGSGPLYPWLWVLVKYHLFLIVMPGFFKMLIHNFINKEVISTIS